MPHLDATPEGGPASKHDTPRQRALYWRLWSGFPRDLGYLALTGILVVAIGIGWGVFGRWVTGSGVLDLIFLALVVLGLLWFGRVFAVVETTRLTWARRSTPRPFARREATSTNRITRILEVARDPHAWLDAAFTALVFPALGFVTASVTAGLILVAICGFIVLPVMAVSGYSGFPYDNAHLALLLAGPVFVVALGIVALLPFVVRGGVLLHEAVARLMLGAFPSEELRAEVQGLEVSRSAAVSAEGTSLRRLERDIHDGPQQRLIRMQMDLAAASRALDTDIDRGRALIDEALQQSREALEELRALSRGFAPPLLLDRGLAAALEAVVDRSAVPTRFTDELPDGLAIPVEIERNAYFIAAELLTNATKHAGATRAELILSTPPGELAVVVSDDGAGGARVQSGHGLAGIEERLLGLGGRLDLRSPVGGPTHIRVVIPMAVPTDVLDRPEAAPDDETDIDADLDTDADLDGTTDNPAIATDAKP